MKRERRAAVATIAAILILAAPAAGLIAAPQQSAGAVIYFVRHAETEAEAADPRDPVLSPQGRARAAELVRILADAALVSVHSTDLQRTRETATPVAEAFGLDIETYDPFDQETAAALVERLGSTPGGHLIVGHSNTTPAFVEAFGGDPLSPIDEDEYDRLYVVTVGAGGAVVSALLRYGAGGTESR